MPVPFDAPITYACAEGRSCALEVKTYPAGEPLITATDLPLRLLVRPRVLEDLYSALYWVDALAERGHAVRELVLPCVPGARQDRLNASGDRLVTIKSIARDINSRRFPCVTVLDPHSDVTPAPIERCRVVRPAEILRSRADALAPAHWDAVISPDAGAEKRALGVAHAFEIPLLHGWKVRDVATGALTGFGVEPAGPEPTLRAPAAARRARVPVAAGRILRLLAALVVHLGAARNGAAAPPLPQHDGFRHEGVAACAGSPCHGKVSKGKRIVWQTEYSIWKQADSHGDAFDQHSDAFRHLEESLSKEIARKLGIGAPEKAALCLDCHADNVPAECRGSRFKVEMGVGCEACHGGSERWIGPHDRKLRPHPENVADGLYPTDEPVAMAELCTSCHVGTRDKLVTHRMMAAGHPRLQFELQIYSLTRPAHFDWETIAERNPKHQKRVAAGIQFWAIGQAVIARRALDLLLDSERGYDGVWPELVLFDCHSCHHKMADKKWRPRASIGHPPGIPHWNDANLLMLRHALIAAAPDQEQGLRDASRALQQDALRGPNALRAAALQLRERLERVTVLLDAWRPGAAAIRRVLESVLEEGVHGEFADPAAAEQLALGTQALIDNLRQAGGLTSVQADALMKVAVTLAKRLDDDENYDRAATRAACAELASMLPK